MANSEKDLEILEKGNAPLEDYDSESIQSLSPLQHIRTRPGMYIGRLGNGDNHNDGIYILLKEVIDNSVDEFVMRAGRKIMISVSEDGMVAVRDYGRGIPLNKVRNCVSEINTGGKFITGDDGVKRPFSSSIGLNGVGLKAVNFLSEYFRARSWRGGQCKTVVFEEGEFVSEKQEADDQENGTEITFMPSKQIFPDFCFKKIFLNQRLQHYAWLNSGLSIECNGEKFYSRRGLLDLLEDKLEADPLYDIVHCTLPNMEFAFCHTNSTNESYYSFVNTQYTNDGGTHQSAFREGILKGILEVSSKNYDSDDVRNGIIGAIAIKLQDPIFESQTKNKLGNTDIRSDIVNKVKKAIAGELYKNVDLKEAIFEKIDKNVEINRQVRAAKKGAKAKANHSTLKIEKLRDCKFHFNEADSKKKPEEREKCGETMLFLTEGNSASGSIVTARDPETQAVFSLRGKPLNCFGIDREKVYQNEELYGIMQAVGIERSLEDLRYAKIIIATDADMDGFHIRNLLITYFLTFFRSLVVTEHLYILETPLFRVRNKKVTHYCYTDHERDECIEKLGKDHEVTRFKGLGEISANEFKQFIGEDVRLQPVLIDSKGREVDKMLSFYMGANVPERREFIMENLI
ncbi:MAG: toprim domain-containing protein [Lentisphaeria bacterium]